MNEFYILIEKARGGVEQVSVITEELLLSMHPLPNGSTAAKYVPCSALEQVQKRVQEKDDNLIRLEQDVYQLRKERVEAEEQRKQAQEEHERQVQAMAAQHLTTTRQMVGEVENRLSHVMAEHQRTSDAWHKEQKDNIELRKHIEDLNQEVEQLQKQVAQPVRNKKWKLTISGGGYGERVKYFESKEAALKFDAEFFKAEDVVRGDQPRSNFTYLTEITIEG